MIPTTHQQKIKNEQDKLIYAFMGGKWMPISNYRGSSFHSFKKNFNSEAACQKWCDKENKVLNITDESEKWFPAPTFTNPFWGKEFGYNHWHHVMAVLEKIESLGYSTQILCFGDDVSFCEIKDDGRRKGYGEDKIKLKAVREAAVEFIRWYNQHKK